MILLYPPSIAEMNDLESKIAAQGKFKGEGLPASVSKALEFVRRCLAIDH